MSVAYETGLHMLDWNLAEAKQSQGSKIMLRPFSNAHMLVPCSVFSDFPCTHMSVQTRDVTRTNI